MLRLRAAIAVLTLLGLVAGCGDNDEGTTSGASAPTPLDERPRSSPEESPSDPDAAPKESPAGDRKEPAVVRVVREYVRALDARDGERVCALFVPGALDEVEFPKDRGGCAASLAASIGYRDPRGLPVWKTARVGDVLSAEVDGGAAKVVATTITLFADREEPSIEDDVVYLVRHGGRWLIAKPSSTLYRAVGIADIPPSVLAPP